MPQMTTVEVLTRARAKMADPANWGRGVRGAKRSRQTFCLVEAIEFAAREPNWTAIGNAKAAVRRIVSPDDNYADLMAWNDSPDRTHAEVIAALDMAIAEEAPK